MKVIIHPSQLKGIVRAPASKSSLQRALAAALLVKRRSSIINPGHSNDDKAALQLIQDLGAVIKKDQDGLSIDSSALNPVAEEVNCGESGLGIRMFTPIIALLAKEIRIKGEGSLLNRPMDFFESVFPQLQVQVSTNGGKLPIVIKGPLQPANIEVDGSLSSQFITGLLMAYSAVHAENVSIKVKDLKSKPYIDLTLAVMKQFGLNVPENRDYKEFVFTTNASPFNELQQGIINYQVEGDWSGGAFLLVAGAIAGPITIRGLDPGSTQADKAIMDALLAADAAIAIEAKGIKIHPSALTAFDFNATDCPDLFPPLVALAAYCKGESRIKGVSRLRHKESNRALTLQEEFGKMGVRIILEEDEMIIQGGEGVNGATVHSRHDHRIAMACAVAALKADGDTTIEEAGAVRKSYPDFFDHLKSLGAAVSLPHQHYNL